MLTAVAEHVARVSEFFLRLGTRRRSVSRKRNNERRSCAILLTDTQQSTRAGYHARLTIYTCRLNTATSIFLLNTCFYTVALFIHDNTRLYTATYSYIQLHTVYIGTKVGKYSSILQATLKCRYYTGYPPVLNVKHTTMDNPYHPRHFTSLETDRVVPPYTQRPYNSTHSPRHIHK
jgi:hypothetical protein